MLVKTSELSSAALDWAVAKCEAKKDAFYRITSSGVITTVICDDVWNYYPSSNWAQGGPIIERTGLHLEVNADHTEWKSYFWGYSDTYQGITPLIAAMRCYVASKLGDTVEVPDELINN